MTTLGIIGGSGGRLEIEGDGLSWDNWLATGKLAGFAELRFQLANGRWLRFDTTANPLAKPPSVTFGSPREPTIYLEIQNNLVFVSEFERRLKKSNYLHVVFHWANPLTPSGLGLWFDLVVVNGDASNKLEFQVETLDAPSQIFCAQRRSVIDPKWESYKIEGNGSFRIGFQDFAAKSFKFASRASSSWEQLPDLLIDPARLAAGVRRPDAFLLDHREWDAQNYSLVGVGPDDPDVSSHMTALDVISGNVPARAGRLALGVETPLDTLSTFRGGKVSLNCVATRVGDARRWILDWRDVPGEATAPDGVSLPGLYREVAGHYPLGLAATAPRERLTFVPTALSSDKPVTLRFEIEADALGTAIRTRLREIGIADGAALTITLGGATRIDGQPTLLAATATAPPDGKPAFRRLRIAAVADQPFHAALFKLECVARPLAAAELMPLGDWVINGVRLSQAAFSSAKFTFELQTARTGDPRPLGVIANVVYTDTSLRAVSQGADAGYQNLGIARAQPVSIDLGGYESLSLNVTESANTQSGRLLRIGAEATAAKPEVMLDVVGLDRNPLTVFRATETVAVAKGQLVAEYSDDSRQPPGWQFLTGTGAMTVVLPPQARGEEMIKGRLKLADGTVVPEQGKPFDFRHGSNARLEVDRSDIDTARVPPLWMMRQLLGQRLGVTGLKLDKADVELLYGMVATVTGTGLRLADLDAFIGRIPFADGMADAKRRGAFEPPLPAPATLARVQGEYAASMAQWIEDLGKRPAYWRVFRDLADRRRVALRDDVEFNLRRSRQSADPFTIGRFATAKSEFSQQDDVKAYDRLKQHDRDRDPLRGGVDWPFQSPNIYKELRSAPKSVAGSIEGLAFGPLGGDGEQSASFSNGKTLIISSTTQGRLNALTVVRVGRIAMLWNHARHVITYERSSRTAPRYAQPPQNDDGSDYLDYQTADHDGFMALRKVREYIEITQPRRRYPDTPTDLPLAGPCKQSSFETVVIPVKASWGRDVDKGFVMPLRGQLSEAEAKFFPEPKAFLEFARAEAKGGGLIASQLANMAQLLFFSSTRENDGGDTDVWPAWPDIDFSVRERGSRPLVPMQPRFAASRVQPNAPRADFGQGRFTLDLVPNTEAADLMHGRQAAAVEARLFAVNFERGRPAGLDAKLRAARVATSPTDARPVELLDQSVAPRLAEADALIRDMIAELRQQAAGLTGKSDLDAFKRDAARLIGDIESAAGKARDLLAKVDAGRLKNLAGNWLKQQEELLDRYGSSVLAALSELAGQLELAANLGIDEARSQALAALDSVSAQALRRVEEVRFIPDQVLGRLDATTGAVQTQMLAEVTRLRDAALAAIPELLARYEQNKDAAAALFLEYKATNAEAVRVLRRLRTDAQRLTDEGFGDLLARTGVGTSAAKSWAQAIDMTLGKIADDLEESVDDVKDFATVEPNWTDLEKLARDNITVAEDWLLARVQSQIDKLSGSGGLANWRDELEPILDLLKDPIDGAAGKLRTATSIADIDAALKQVKNALTGDEAAANIKAALAELASKFKERIENQIPLDELQGEFDRAKDFIVEAEAQLKALGEALKKQTFEMVTAELKKAADVFAATFNGAVQHVEAAIVREIDTKLGGLATLVEDNVTSRLEIVRVLAEGPVTDTLRCTRDQLGYYYTAGTALLEVTRSSAIFNDLGPAVLNGLSAMLPFDRVRERLLLELKDFPYSTLFPDFAGLKLEYFFPELRELDDTLKEYDWLKVAHGFDKDRLTAWADIAIDKQLEDAPAMFELPPVALRLGRPRFVAHSRIEIVDGRNRQQVSGSIKADWQLELSGTPLVTIVDGVLVFGNDGKFDFQFDSEKLELSEQLKFITEALKNLLPVEEGLTLTPLLPAGIGCSLSLPLPDIGTGAFTLTGITLNTHFDLLIGERFQVRTGFWLSSPDRPFGLAVLFLGGGGWVGIDIDYSPPDKFVTRVSIGISAGAFVAVNFGFARASAGLLFTVGVDFYRSNEPGGGGRSVVSLGLLIWGEFSLLGIAHAYLRLTARIEYSSAGGMVAYGRVSIGIRISFFYTLRINRQVKREFSKPLGRSAPLSTLPGIDALARTVLTNASIADAVRYHYAALDT